MKKILLALAFISAGLQIQAQSGIDSTGLPGDQFSLQGALALFKEADSPEAFEKLINTASKSVNNLDLNGDGETDYVRVVSKMEKDMHLFVLQVPVSESESQDIAVIELEKTGEESAVLQIIGDADIYGEELIVEPDGGEEDKAIVLNEEEAWASGPAMPEYDFETRRIVVNVWLWPAVRFVYAPAYRPWVSPWRWRHYPAWWRPWRPLGWQVWHPARLRYHRHFVIAPTHRVVRVHRIYTPLRVSSVSVRTRHAVTVNNYRVTRTRTTVTGPRGNKVTRTKTTVRGKQGKVKRVKTRRVR
jgi:hypothetical protein